MKSDGHGKPDTVICAECAPDGIVDTVDAPAYRILPPARPEAPDAIMLIGYEVHIDVVDELRVRRG